MKHDKQTTNQDEDTRILHTIDDEEGDQSLTERKEQG